MLHESYVFQILVCEAYVEGFYIRFRALSAGSQQYNMVTVLNAGSTGYTVANLQKFTNYEFFLVPFFKSIDGRPSNSKIVQTAEDGKH
jgi:roundabout axon guidance receptor 2